MTTYAFELTNEPGSRNNLDAWLWLEDQAIQGLADWHWNYTYKDGGQVSVFLIRDQDLATTFTLMFSERIEAKGFSRQLPLQKHRC